MEIDRSNDLFDSSINISRILLNQSKIFSSKTLIYSYTIVCNESFAIIFSNFSTKIYATFSNEFGTYNEYFVFDIFFYYYHNMSFCNSILQKYNYLSKQNCSFIMYPYIRSRYVIDFFTKTKQKKIM